jgi:hypothetical protein
VAQLAAARVAADGTAARAFPDPSGAGAGRDVEVPCVAAVELPTARRAPTGVSAGHTVKELAPVSDAEACGAGIGVGEGRGQKKEERR